MRLWNSWVAGATRLPGIIHIEIGGNNESEFQFIEYVYEKHFTFSDVLVEQFVASASTVRSQWFVFGRI